MMLMFFGADFHLHYRQYKKDERINDFLSSTHFLLDHAIKRGAKVIIIGGDLWNSKQLNADALEEAENLLKTIPDNVPIIIIPGNHDDPDWIEYLSTHLDNVYDIDKEMFEFENVRFYGVGYKPRGIKEEHLPEPDPQFDGINVLILHTAIDLGLFPVYGKYLCKDCVDTLVDKWDYILVGHVHIPFVEYNKIFSPGAPERCSFAELDHNGGGWLIDTKGKRFEHIESTKRPMFEFNENVDFTATSNLCKDDIEGAIVRVIITGERLDPLDISKLEERFSSALVCKILNRSIQKKQESDVDSKSGKDKLAEDIFSQHMSNERFTTLIELRNARRIGRDTCDYWSDD